MVPSKKIGVHFNFGSTIRGAEQGIRTALRMLRQAPVGMSSVASNPKGAQAIADLELALAKVVSAISALETITEVSDD